MKNQIRKIVRILTMINLAFLFGYRKDYPVAAILFIAVVDEIVAMIKRSSREKGIVKHTLSKSDTSCDDIDLIG